MPLMPSSAFGFASRTFLLSASCAVPPKRSKIDFHSKRIVYRFEVSTDGSFRHMGLRTFVSGTLAASSHLRLAIEWLK